MVEAEQMAELVGEHCSERNAAAGRRPPPPRRVQVEPDHIAVRLRESCTGKVDEYDIDPGEPARVNACPSPKGPGRVERRRDLLGRERRNRRPAGRLQWCDERGVVVDDRDDRGAIGDRGAGGVREDDREVSVGSAVRLLTMLTVKLAVVAPAAKVTVAVFAWKSLPASAVPATVVAVTVTAVAAGADSRTVTVTVVVLSSPSVTVRSSIESCGTSLSAIEPVPAAGEPTV